MDIADLQSYYDKKQSEYKAYLENELQKVRDANNKYLSDAIAEACEHAKKLLESSNEKAFERFKKAEIHLKSCKKENYSKSILELMESQMKKDLETSLRMNQSLFDSSISYYQDVLKK